MVHRLSGSASISGGEPSAHLRVTVGTAGEAKVRVEGTVADVCSKMGCWLVLQQGDDSIRVTLKDHGFGVDRDSAGKTASLEGTLRQKDVDPEQAAHFESESRKPEAMPEKAGLEYEIDAAGVVFSEKS